MGRLRKVWLILFITLFSSSGQATETYLAIGLMTGTSMDGIDATLLETDGQNYIREVAHESLKYSKDFTLALKEAESLARVYDGDLSKITKFAMRFMMPHLPFEIGRDIEFDAVVKYSTQLHGQLVRTLLEKADRSASEVKVIGYHGQTLLHKPKVLSLQIGDGQLLADMTGIPVVNNFRAQDIEAGGQGAPFAPLFHQALAARDGLIPCAVVNNGGIANISLIYGAGVEDLVAFDTGPGNCLIDGYVRNMTRGGQLIDRDGWCGLKGQVDQQRLKALYERSAVIGGVNYYRMPPPKSLDSGNLNFSDMEGCELYDGCATLEAFTADTIVKSLELVPYRPFPKTWVLCGGGWHNPVTLRELVARLPSETRVLKADELNWNNSSFEAQIFAWMAVRSLKQLPLSVPSTTGVPEPMTGGTFYYPSLAPKKF